MLLQIYNAYRQITRYLWKFDTCTLAARSRKRLSAPPLKSGADPQVGPFSNLGTSRPPSEVRAGASKDGNTATEPRPKGAVCEHIYAEVQAARTSPKSPLARSPAEGGPIKSEEPAKPGGILQALSRSPLVGADLAALPCEPGRHAIGSASGRGTVHGSRKRKRAATSLAHPIAELRYSVASGTFTQTARRRDSISGTLYFNRASAPGWALPP